MPRKARLCDHVFVNGDCCEAVALKDSKFCYWHHAGRERRRVRQNAWPTSMRETQLPLLEDANSLMVTLQEVIHAIIDGRIDRATSGHLLYAIQTAATLVPHVSNQSSSVGRHLFTLPEPGEELSLPAPAETPLQPISPQGEDPRPLLLAAREHTSS